MLDHMTEVEDREQADVAGAQLLWNYLAALRSSHICAVCAEASA